MKARNRGSDNQRRRGKAVADAIKLAVNEAAPPPDGGNHMDNANIVKVEQKKGVIRRIAAWCKNLFVSDEKPRKRGTLRKRALPVRVRVRAHLNGAKTSMLKAKTRLVDAAKATGRNVAAWGRWVAPRLISALRAVAHELEPIVALTGTVVVAVTGSILVTNMVVAMAGFMGEALAAAVAFIGTYYTVFYATALLSREGRETPDPTNELSDVPDSELPLEALEPATA